MSVAGMPSKPAIPWASVFRIAAPEAVKPESGPVSALENGSRDRNRPSARFTGPNG